MNWTSFSWSRNSGQLRGGLWFQTSTVEPLERTVLEQVANILADPQRILEEAKHHDGQWFDEARANRVDEEPEKIEGRQGRLANLCVKGSLPQNILEAKSEELSRQRLEAEHRVSVASRPRGLDLISRLSVPSNRSSG